MLGAVRVTSESLEPLIEEIAAKYGVDANLVKGTIKKESNWDVNASRYEAHINDSSWGLMQVLLRTAREILGRPELTLQELQRPEVNIEAGTKYLAKQLTRYKGNIRDAISAYNAGTAFKKKDGSYNNQSYVDDVYRNYMMYRTIGAAVSPAEASIGFGALALGLGLLISMRK